MGRSNLINLASQNIVALCDVDWGYTDKNLSRLDTDISNLQAHIDHPDATPATGKPAPKIDPEKTKERLDNILHLKNDLIPKAKRYSDYRKMLDQQKDIDGVVIATPDHMHATIALACMDVGKHVYVQKPLCWSVDEARRLSKRAAETKLATQMGNQGRSLDDTRTAVEYIWSGAIGDVREIHVWTDRPVGFWPQGVPRPKAAVGTFGCVEVGSIRSGYAAGSGYGGKLSCSGNAVMGFVPWRGSGGSVSPDLSSVQLARMDGLGMRSDWRYGGAFAGCFDVGVEPWFADVHRNSIDSFQRRFVSERRTDFLRVPGARFDATGEADLV